MGITDITVLDDYSIASEYLIELALVTGNGKMLRAIKTLMDAASRLTTATPDAAISAPFPVCEDCGEVWKDHVCPPGPPRR